MVELAKAMEETEVAELLAGILGEEKQQDERLTEITRRAILPAALSSGAEDKKEGTADDEAKSSGRAKKPSKSIAPTGGAG
jgi:hypothetical protein